MPAEGKLKVIGLFLIGLIAMAKGLAPGRRQLAQS